MALARLSSSCSRSLIVLMRFVIGVGEKLFIWLTFTSLMGSGAVISCPVWGIILIGDVSLCQANSGVSYSPRSCIGMSQGSYPRFFHFLVNSVGTCCHKGYWID